MLTLNVLSAVVGMILAALVVRGYAPNLKVEGSAARRFMVVGIMILMAVAICRMGWWDLMRPTLGWLGVMAPTSRTDLSSVINTALNLGKGAGALCLLAALYHTIPVQDRGGYSWLTSPFYPPEQRLWPFRRSGRGQ